ncbi:hypothetical protein AM593_09251, partial [Mytilus galloprovincialis]
MSGHSATKLLTIGCMIFVWAVMIVVNALATVKLGRDIGLFKNTTGDISDKYYTQITPAGWTFSIWGVIYTWQGIFMNSLAFYAAWVTVASLINLVVVLVYDADVEQELACTITLGILSFEIVAWFIIDNFIIDKYFQTAK